MGLQAKHLLSKGLGRWRVIVAVAAGLLTMAATVYALWQYRFVLSKSTPKPTPQSITIRPVTALGRLEPDGEAIHASTIA
jgi:HlyD family secretion protein